MFHRYHLGVNEEGDFKMLWRKIRFTIAKAIVYPVAYMYGLRCGWDISNAFMEHEKRQLYEYYNEKATAFTYKVAKLLWLTDWI